MKLAILGTRGIPNNYGGFEQFAEYISVGLVNKGHDVTVYNPTSHPYKKDEFKGVKIIRANSPENILGSAANFIYDYHCLKDAAKRDFDIIYEAGYATCSPFLFLLKNSTVKLITNMDGIEWKRSKWNFFTKKLMKYLESLSVKKSQFLVADNLGIQQYFKEAYNKDSFCIAYGANLSNDDNIENLGQFNVHPENYFMLIARLEPENNIELILEAYKNSERSEPFLVIGSYETKYGKYLFKKYNNTRIKFLGSIYNKPVLDSLRYYCKAYLHGHSVGGTNPSLLEAMASSAFIIAHNNPFNNSILKLNALYFTTQKNLTEQYLDIDKKIALLKTSFINNNIHQIKTNFSWQYIIEEYENIFNNIVLKNSND